MAVLKGLGVMAGIMVVPLIGRVYYALMSWVFPNTDNEDVVLIAVLVTVLSVFFGAMTYDFTRKKG